MKELKHYWVVTPKYSALEEYIEGYSLYSDVVDCVAVIASSKREARVKGYYELKRIKSEWLDYQRQDKKNPFSGLKVDSALCEHGECWCDICVADYNWTECQACLDKWEEAAQNV